MNFFEDDTDDNDYNEDNYMSLDKADFLAKWNCDALYDIGTIVRYFNSNVECLSKDRFNCIWGAKREDCQRLIDLYGKGNTSLACGEHHLITHGTIGYGFPNHWCERTARHYYPFINHPITSAWRCDLLSALGVIVRYVNGDIECLSHNGKDCIWNTSYQNCLFLSSDQNQVELIHSLQCGEMHDDHYHGPGYNIPGHWCAKALKLYKG